jgi:hypothetical protein
MEDAVRAWLDSSRTFIRMARENAALVGVTGMPGTPGSVTATMFTPCSNTASAATPDRTARRVVRTCTLLERRPEPQRHCSLPGSWERPDNGFADRVLAIAAKGDAPDFEMPAGTGNDTGEATL